MTQIDQISSLLSEIRTPLIEVGVSVAAIAFKRERLEKAEEKDVRACLIWLIAFNQVYIEQYKKAKGAVPDSVWQMYKNLGTRGTYEQVQLNDAKRLLILTWYNRPDLLKRKPSGKPKTKHRGTGKKTH